MERQKGALLEGALLLSHHRLYLVVLAAAGLLVLVVRTDGPDLPLRGLLSLNTQSQSCRQYTPSLNACKAEIHQIERGDPIELPAQPKGRHNRTKTMRKQSV